MGLAFLTMVSDIFVAGSGGGEDEATQVSEKEEKMKEILGEE